jgi:aspartate-semialdehyde dehydrogenase
MSSLSTIAPGKRLPAKPRIAVVGASGLVGQMVLEILAQRSFPHCAITELSPREAAPAAAAQADLVFLAAPSETAHKYAPILAAAGCIVIDLSPAWRLNPQVPLVIPEIHAEQISQHCGILASPNCTNVPLAMVLAALQRRTKIQQVDVTTMQAASGAGRAGLSALEGDSAAFGRSLADNLIPQCDAFHADGHTAEELRIQTETQRLLATPQLAITATCVRVPTKVGHALSLVVRTAQKFSSGQAAACLETMPGIQLYTTNGQPHLQDCVGNDQVHVGRLRQGVGGNELLLWVVCDNLRKGAATNAVQIAEQLLPSC